jgi:hypothetical protein
MCGAKNALHRRKNALKYVTREKFLRRVGHAAVPEDGKRGAKISGRKRSPLARKIRHAGVRVPKELPAEGEFVEQSARVASRDALAESTRQYGLRGQPIARDVRKGEDLCLITSTRHA